jgi:hypothetical protein
MQHDVRNKRTWRNVFRGCIINERTAVYRRALRTSITPLLSNLYVVSKVKFHSPIEFILVDSTLVAANIYVAFAS